MQPTSPWQLQQLIESILQLKYTSIKIHSFYWSFEKSLSFEYNIWRTCARRSYKFLKGTRASLSQEIQRRIAARVDMSPAVVTLTYFNLYWILM